VSILVEDQLRGKIELDRAKGTTLRIVFGIAIEAK
jgi:two-component sensor histidine kinase